jgi:molybdopterin-synthase adenylyltransferase
MDTRTFLQLVSEAGILNNVVEADIPALSKRGLAYSVFGEVNIDSRQLKICIAASSQFPRQHPVFFYLNNSEFEPVPHVEDDGMVCYLQEDAIVLDIDNPVGIIRECFEMAIATLRDGFSKKNEKDFYNEYEAYWRRLKNIVPAFTSVFIDDRVRAIRYQKFPNKEVLFAWSEDTDGVKLFERLFPSDKKLSNPYYGVFIPLERGSKIFIPKDSTELSSVHLREIISGNLSPENQKQLQTLLASGKHDDLVIFCLPQPNGYYSLFGARLKNIAFDKHPLLSANTKVDLVPLSISRLDKEYMLARGGTGKKYLDKKVLLVGGGSVGGHICDELIKAAIVNIDVVDRDNLMPDNCYRHVCGFTNVLMNKTKAIKKRMEAFYPHANVNAIDCSIEQVLEKKKINLQSYDVIVVATGNPTLNQYLNKVFRVEVPNTPVLYCWLDPYGIGGHCLVSNISKQGCYQCLYSNYELHNIASFADLQQPKSFLKNIAGCGSTYIPYGALDAIQTAILSTRQVLGIFEGEVKQNRIESWKGNAALFLAEGYKLSRRYSQSSEELELSKHLFYQSNCTVCGRE